MLDLLQVKAHLRIEPEWVDEDTYIQGLLDAAIEQVESDTQYRFNETALTLALPCFTPEIPLPVCPVKSVESITYIDVDGVQQTLTGYHLDNKSIKAVIKPEYGSSFPSVKAGYESVAIGYTVGAALWPKTICQAVFLLVGHWYANRETVVTGTITAELPMAYNALIQSYRVPF